MNRQAAKVAKRWRGVGAWQCPFTVEELIQQRVSDEQIARMHHVDVEYVASIRGEIERAEEEKRQAKDPGGSGGKRSRTPVKAEVTPTLEPSSA